MTTATYWSRRLAKRVKLASGAELVTLRDAGEFLLVNFQAVLEIADLYERLAGQAETIRRRKFPREALIDIWKH